MAEKILKYENNFIANLNENVKKSLYPKKNKKY